MTKPSAAIESIAARCGVDLLAAFEMFLERAAIREYDAGMAREDAEKAAIADVTRWAEGSDE